MLPDAPEIRMMERFGTLKPEEPPVCPICGKECDTIYRDMNDQVFGCDCCIRRQDAWDWKDEEENT